MIHHMTIAAQNPQHVAQVLAEILQGQAVPFPAMSGAYMVAALDQHGTAIGILPAGAELKPGTDEQGCMFEQNPQATRFTATHAAVSVALSQAEIEQIGAREGWRVVRCRHEDFFDVLEFWVENTLLIELLPPEMAARYLEFAQQPDVLKQFMVEPETAIA